MPGKGVHGGFPAFGQIGGHTADAEPGGVQPAAGDQFDDVQNHFAFTEGVERGGHGAHVMGIGAQPDQMVAQAEQLAEQHADALGARGHLDAGQLLHGHHIGQVVGRPGQIVHPVGVGDELVPGLAFADLFRRPMVVADLDVHVGDGFPVQTQHVADQTVGAHVVGSHIEDQVLPAAAVLEKPTAVARLQPAGVRLGVGRPSPWPVRDGICAAGGPASGRASGCAAGPGARQSRCRTCRRLRARTRRRTARYR